MKVLITTDSYYPHVNGASIFGQRLAIGLRDRGHSVLVIAPGTSLRSGYSEVAGVPFFGVSSVPVVFYKGMRIAVPGDLERTTRRVMRDFQPEVVHAQGHFTVSKAVIANARAAGVPVVATNHFMPENLTHYAHLPASMDTRLQRWLWMQFRGVYDNVSAVTTPTFRAAAYMKSRGFGAEIQVVSNGIDLGRFYPRAEGDGLRDRYGLPGVPLLLYVGRLDKEKNLDLVLRAVSMVPPTVPIHVAIAGTGARRDALEKLATRLGVSGRATFLGFVPDEDLPMLYSTAYCFVMAGTAELQSIATMEAMASGLPVVAANAVALPELVLPGRNGCLFEPGNPEMLSGQITLLFTDRQKRDAMAKQSLKLIQDHAFEHTIKKFEASYAACARGTAPAWSPSIRRRARRVVASPVS